jgi:hypothetical protein
MGASNKRLGRTASPERLDKRGCPDCCPANLDVSLIKTMWSNAVGQGGHMEERPKKSVTVGTRSALDGRINRKEIRIG